jgi:hypothetical protein
MATPETACNCLTGWASNVFERLYPGHLLRHGFHRVFRGKDRVRQETVIDDRRLVAITQFGVPGSCGGVLHHGDLEALLQQFAQVAFDTEMDY